MVLKMAQPAMAWASKRGRMARTRLVNRSVS